MCFVILCISKQAKIRAGVQVRERSDTMTAGKMEQTTTTTTTLCCCNICTGFKHTTQKSLILSLVTADSELQTNINSSIDVNHDEFNLDQEALKRHQDEMEEAAKSPPLSVKQLVLRRGLAILVMLLILGAGILVNKITLKLLI